MSHDNEYHDNMVKMLELIWGRDYMAPGGPGNVARMLAGLSPEGKRILDIGSVIANLLCVRMNPSDAGKHPLVIADAGAVCDVALIHRDRLIL